MTTETGTTRMQLAGILLGLVLFTLMVGTWIDYALAATEPKALAEVPPSAYALGTPMPPAVEKLIAQALAAAPQPLPCRPVFKLEEIAEEGVAGSASSTCEVILEPNNFDEPADFEWWAPWLVRHEVAHLVTMAHSMGDPHGPLFRLVLDEMLEPLGIDEVYADDAQEYPEKVYYRNGCVQGCDL